MKFVITTSIGMNFNYKQLISWKTRNDSSLTKGELSIDFSNVHSLRLLDVDIDISLLTRRGTENQTSHMV